jgi:hypothetical protein
VLSVKIEWVNVRPCLAIFALRVATPKKTGKGDKMIFLFTREGSYDENLGFVVRANTEAEARKCIINSWSYGDEGKHVWFDSELTKCQIIEFEGETKIILNDFLAG